MILMEIRGGWMKAKILDLNMFSDGEDTDLQWSIMTSMDVRCLKT